MAIKREPVLIRFHALDTEFLDNIAIHGVLLHFL